MPTGSRGPVAVISPFVVAFVVIVVIAVVAAVVAAGCGDPSPSESISGSEPDIGSAPSAGTEVRGTVDEDGIASDTSAATTSSSVPGPDPTGPDSRSSGLSTDQPTDDTVIVGAQRLVDVDLAPLAGRRVGLIANRASMVGDRSVIDVLHQHPDVELVALFAAEHGLRADGDAGAEVVDGRDPATGVVVHSLYGVERAPTPAALDGLDLLVFDLQDAGARFYTYTSTMGLAMQAAARAGIGFVVLDRPNPLGGDRPDGPIGDETHRSFLGLYPVPALHAMTAGELATAVKGEGWLDDLDQLDLDVIPLEGWQRTDRWADTGLEWIPPSPGLPTDETALLYPATVLLEATTVAYGRETDRPFTQFGAPWLDGRALAAELEALDLPGVGFEAVTFTPEGGETVSGVRLEVTDRATLRPLVVGVHIVHRILEAAGDDREVIVRPRHFDLLAGGPTLREELVAGRDPSDIIGGWAADLARWDAIAARYHLY